MLRRRGSGSLVAYALQATDPIALAFVSKRVGNVQVNPLRVLIAQMWVQ